MQEHSLATVQVFVIVHCILEKLCSNIDCYMPHVTRMGKRGKWSTRARSHFSADEP